MMDKQSQFPKWGALATAGVLLLGLRAPAAAAGLPCDPDDLPGGGEGPDDDGDECSFTITGTIPLPLNDHDSSGEFASGSVDNAKLCNPHRASEYRGIGLDAANDMRLIGATDASGLLNHFLEGTGTPVDFPDGSTLSEAVKTDSQFIALNKAVQAAAAAQFNAGQASANVTANLILPVFSLFSSGSTLFFAFGGTQGMDVKGDGFVQGGSYTGTITYTIRDIYGFFDNNRFLLVGKKMHYLQGICGAPFSPGGAQFFADSVTVTVPFTQPAP